MGWGGVDSAKKKVDRDSEERQGEQREEGEVGRDRGEGRRGGGWKDIKVGRTLKLKAAQCGTGIFVFIVGPVLLGVQLGEEGLILAQLVLGRRGLTPVEGERLHGFGTLLEDTLGGGHWLVLGEPPAGIGFEGGGGGAGQGARIGHRAEGEVHLPHETQVKATARGRGGADELRAGDAVGAEKVPEGPGLTAAGPGVAIEPQELDGVHVTHRLTGQLCQGVVEEEEHGETAKVAEGAAVDLSHTVVVQQQPVQVDQAPEHILGQGADAVAMEEKLAQVDEVREQVILQEVELVFLQVEELQAVQLVENVMGQSCQPAPVHVQALQLLQATEGTPFQTAQMRVVTQVELLQVTHLTEGARLNPGEVVGEKPEDL